MARVVNMCEQEQEDIYDAVPQWFTPNLSREDCDKAVAQGNPGDYLVRESAKGDRYVICVNHLGKSKNFQILVEDGKYKFSGKVHATLERGPFWCICFLPPCCYVGTGCIIFPIENPALLCCIGLFSLSTCLRHRAVSTHGVFTGCVLLRAGSLFPFSRPPILSGGLLTQELHSQRQ